MKQLFTLLAGLISLYCSGQQMTLKKGVVLDSLPVTANDTISETFSLYLPTKFELSRTWPVLVAFDMKGQGKRALNVLAKAAEEQGYILASSNNLSDTLSIAQNILIVGRLINTVTDFLPIHKSRMYGGGFASGGRFATLVPTFIKEFQGILVCGASVANTEVLTSKNAFRLIGIVGNEDYNYPEMLAVEEILNRMRFPNHLMVFDGGHNWPQNALIEDALEIFILAAMAKGQIDKNNDYIASTYQQNLTQVNLWFTAKKPLLANYLLDEMLEIYRPFRSTDSIKNSQKTLKRSKLYKNQKRNLERIFFKEGLVKEDYQYYLEEDVLTYNYNNLGWWKYQTDELDKLLRQPQILEQQSGKRLQGYVKALVADNIDIIKSVTPPDEKALNFLWMLKTIIDVKDYNSYLSIISYNAKVNDNSTALFYLEELLKNGFTDSAQLYALDDTALLRLTPEFNDLIEKYLKTARYDID